MRITKSEVENNIGGKNPIATCYGGLAELGLEIYEIDSSAEIIYFVEIVGTKETCEYWNEMFEVSEEAREVLTILSMRNS